MDPKEISNLITSIVTTNATAIIGINAIFIAMFSAQGSPFITSDIHEQEAFAQSANNNKLIDLQVDRPEASAGNITADIKPQGTALDVENVTSMEDRPEASAGNITADIKPQGTALGVED